MKNKEKITVKQFVEEYNKRPIQTRDSYVKDSLSIISYIPLLQKESLTNKIINASMYEYEDCTDSIGNKSRRKTDRIKINSVGQYILLCRVLVENYTNLKIETDGFFEEYDLLKSSGLLDKLMVGNDTTLPLIPVDEIIEIKSLLEMKQKDIMSNYMNPQTYISEQLDRLMDVIGIATKPIIDGFIANFQNKEFLDNAESETKFSFNEE